MGCLQQQARDAEYSTGNLGMLHVTWAAAFLSSACNVYSCYAEEADANAQLASQQQQLQNHSGRHRLFSFAA